MWERSATLDPAFPTVWRNLSLAAYNKQGDAAKARECMERAYALDPTDARVLLELDQLYRKLGMPVEERFAFLHSHRETVFIRDDLTIEYCTLLNDMGRYEDALSIILNRKFHPWEGDEEAAARHLSRAAAGNEEPASAMYYNDQPAELILYEGLAALALGDRDHASARFHKLIAYGEKHYYDRVQIDYFAVSLPDLQLFDEDLTLRNRAHCEYLIALGSYGLGDKARAKACFDAALAIDCSHQGVILHKKLL